jgi:hypothetical protein
MPKYANELIALAMQEQGAAESQYGELSSEHEMYAVLLEEVQETDEESGTMITTMEELWDLIRDKSPVDTMQDKVIELQDSALKVAEYALQVVAVCNLAKKLLEDIDGEG